MKLVLCESKDEENLARAVLDRPDVTFHNLRGADQLRAQIVRNRPDYPDLAALGVLIDAEGDPAATLAKAGRFFGELGHSAPRHAEVLAGPPRIGVFLLPDGSTPGSYETLIRRTVPAERAACVDGLFECAGGVPAAARTQAERDKVWFHAYAATLGPEARHRGLFGPAPAVDPAHPALDPLRRFLGSLVGQ